jgi:hypothetical protein
MIIPDQWLPKLAVYNGTVKAPSQKQLHGNVIGLPNDTAGRAQYYYIEALKYLAFAKYYAFKDLGEENGKN